MAHIMLALLAFFLFFPVLSAAQQIATTRREGTIAQMPVCNASIRGYTFSVTNAISSTDCTSGGGAFINFCVCDGTIYVDYAAGGSVGGLGTLTTIKENNVQIGGTNIAALDFLGADFDCTETPASEVNCTIAAAIARDSELAAHTALTTGVHGIANTANLLDTGDLGVTVQEVNPQLAEIISNTYPATKIPFTPTGTISATNVQAAIAEVASESTGGPPGGAGTLTTIKGNDIQIGSPNIITLDFFGTDFNCFESPVTEVNCLIADTVTRDTELTSAITTHESDSTSVHGISNTADLLTLSAIGTSVQAFDSDLSEIAANTYPATKIPFTPVGTISSTDVQSAIAEVASEAGTGTGTGTLNIIKENNTQIGSPSIVALDFLGTDFDCTESPLNEINCSISAAIARDTEITSAITAHEQDTLSVHGIADTSQILLRGNLTDTLLCKWNAATSRIDCTTTVGGTSIGTLSTIKENDTQVGGQNIVTLDFLGADFDCSTSPITEVNCSISTAITRDTELAAHEADTTNIHGIPNTTVLLTTSAIGTSVQAFDTDLSEISNNTYPATKIPFTPVGTIAATNVQAAIAEVASEATGGGGSGSLTTIKEDNIAIGGSSITTLDFLGADFDCSESPTNEINCLISAALTRDSELTAHESDSTNIHGIANTANLLTTSAIGVSIQAFDSDLSEIAANTYAASKIPFTPGGGISASNVQTAIAEADTDLTAHINATTGVHGIANTANLLTTSAIGTSVQAFDSDLTEISNNTYAATKIPFTPGGTVAATNVQAAIAEVAAEAAAGGLGTLTTIKEDNTQVGSSTIAVLDFLGADFDCSESPTNEVNCLIAAAITRDSELAAHDSDTTAVHGIANTANLLTTSAIGTTVQAFDTDLSEISANTYPASKIPFTPGGMISASNVQTAIAEIDSDLTAHANATTSVHGIANTANLLTTSAIGVSVQAFDTDLSEISNNTYPASKIPFTPTGTISSTNVQAAIAEAASETGAGLTPDSVNASHMADADHGGGKWENNTLFIDAIRSGNAFPSTPTTNDLFLLLTDTSDATCVAGVGATQTLCRWDGAAWTRVAIETDTFESVISRGRSVTSATAANPVKIGGSTHSWHFYQDGAGAMKQRACLHDGTSCTTFAKQLEAASDWALINESGTTCGSFDSATMQWTPTYNGTCSPNLVTGVTVGGGLAAVNTASGVAIGIEGCAPGEFQRRKWDGTAYECWPSNKHQPAVPAGPTHTMVDSDCGSTIGNVTAAALTVNLLADPTGCTICFFAETNQSIKLEPSGSDIFVVSGLTPVAGDSITLTAGIGNNVCVQGKNSTTWWVLLGTGAVTDTN